MNSEILFFLILGILVVFLGSWIVFLETRLRRFFKGENGKNLEKVLTSLTQGLEKLEGRAQASESRLENMEEELKNCIQKTKVVRFNPFDDVGGNQSFTVALLDNKKSGVVFSSLYGREINRVYAKPIQNGSSQYQLSEEEKEAIEKAG